MPDETHRRVLQSTGVALTASLAGCSSGGAGNGSNGSSGDSSDGDSNNSSDGESGLTSGSSDNEYEPVTFLETPGETLGDSKEMWEPFSEYDNSQVEELDPNVEFNYI